MINILIVENDIHQLNELKELIEGYDFTWNVLCARSFNSAMETISGNNISLFIININLSNNENSSDEGIRLGHTLRNSTLYSNTPIIYISDQPDKIYDAVNNIHCYGYITKPYDSKTIYDILKSLINTPLLKEQPFRFRDVNGIYFYVNPNNIVYISTSGKKININTSNASCCTTGITLTQLTDILPSYLMQCHRQYIINTLLVQNYDKTNCIITTTSGIKVPVGRKYKKSFENMINL